MSMAVKSLLASPHARPVSGRGTVRVVKLAGSRHPTAGSVTKLVTAQWLLVTALCTDHVAVHLDDVGGDVRDVVR